MKHHPRTAKKNTELTETIVAEGSGVSGRTDVAGAEVELPSSGGGKSELTSPARSRKISRREGSKLSLAKSVTEQPPEPPSDELKLDIGEAERVQTPRLEREWFNMLCVGLPNLLVTASS